MDGAGADGGLFVEQPVLEPVWNPRYHPWYVGNVFRGIGGVAIFAKKNRVLALCMPVITNALLVPIVLSIFAEQAYWLGVIYVGIGQAIACVGLGYPLAKALDKVKFLNEGM